MKLSIIPILFLIIASFKAPTYAEDKEPYTNLKYKFTLGYPSTCQLKTFGDAYFDLLENGKIIVRAGVEDDTFKIYIHEWKPKGDIFQKFSKERCKIICDADGPDGSTYCDEIKSQRQYVSANGLRVLEFYLIMTREDYSRNTKSESTVGPVYMVDISKDYHPLALMIHPGHGTLASKKVK